MVTNYFDCFRWQDVLAFPQMESLQPLLHIGRLQPRIQRPSANSCRLCQFRFTFTFHFTFWKYRCVSTLPLRRNVFATTRVFSSLYSVPLMAWINAGNSIFAILLHFQIKVPHVFYRVRAPSAVVLGRNILPTTFQRVPVPIEWLGCVVVFDGKQRVRIDILTLRFQASDGLIDMFPSMKSQPAPDLTASIDATDKLALRVQ